MARRVVKLPDIGEGTTEAEIVGWLVKIGDRVDEEEPLAEVMTDKATVEIPAPVSGTVVSLNGKIGQKLAVGSDLVVLETDAGSEAAAAPHPGPLPARGERERVDTPRPVYGEREGPAPKAWEGEGQPPKPL